LFDHKLARLNNLKWQRRRQALLRTAINKAQPPTTLFKGKRGVSFARDQAYGQWRPKAHAMARPNGGHHTGIGGHQAPTPPALDDADRFCAAHYPVVEPIECWHVQMRAGLGKGTDRDTTQPRSIAVTHAGVKMGEEGIKKGLLGSRSHRQQRRNQCGQWQLAVSGKRFGKTWMACPLGKRVRCDQIGEVQQELLYEFTVLRPPW